MNRYGLEGVALSALDFSTFPYFLFTPELVRKDLADWKRALKGRNPAVSVYYSVKTNSHGPLLEMFLKEGLGLELLGDEDVKRAAKAGASGDQILYSGASWDRDQLEFLIQKMGVRRFTVDGPENGELLRSALDRNSVRASELYVALRVNDGENHLGFPANAPDLQKERSRWEGRGPVRWGLHCHSNSHKEANDPNIYYLRDRFRLLTSLIEKIKMPWHFLNLGGGLHSPWNSTVPSQDLGAFHTPDSAPLVRSQIRFPRFSAALSFKDSLDSLYREIDPHWGIKEIWMEPGRSLVSRAIHGVLTVTQIKNGLFPGHQVVITNGNTAALGPLHREVHPHLFIRNGALLPMEKLVPSFVYGSLPHGADWLLQNEPLPPLSIGDKIVFLHLGAYFLPLASYFGFEPWPIFSHDAPPNPKRAD